MNKLVLSLLWSPEKRCHNCGRKGTRQFKPYPDKPLDMPGTDPQVPAGAWGWECSNKTACRKRAQPPKNSPCWCEGGSRYCGC